MKRLRLLLVGPLFAAACVDAQKSENPLSPTIAGPIAGVFITQPDTVEPKDNMAVPVGNQPITLVLRNAESNGVRPLHYRFELAADINFSNTIFVRDDITPGEGRTSVRLPDALAPERTYYWRARAEDGANVSDYSGFAFFRVYTPIVIQKPVLQNPVNNVETSTVQPEFAIANAPRSGPVGTVGYEIELSDSATFANNLAIWVVAEQPGLTRFSPGALPAGGQYFWRARAFDPRVVGPWSDTQAFRTPRVVSTPSPGTPPPSNCSAVPGSVLQTLECLRRGYPHPMSAGHRGSLLNATAWAHRGEGWGMHAKSGGNLCPQPNTGRSISCDLLVHGPTGAVYDVLENEENPIFFYKGTIDTMNNFVAPVQP